MDHIKEIIEKAWEDRSLICEHSTIEAAETVVARLNKGELRVAEPVGNQWVVNEWIKKAVIFELVAQLRFKKIRRDIFIDNITHNRQIIGRKRAKCCLFTRYQELPVRYWE